MDTPLHSSSSSSSGRAAATAAAAAAAGASSSTASESKQLVQGQAAWQQARNQWQHVPAMHKQILGLFGASAQAAVWVAAIMSHIKLPVLTSCWGSIPLLLPACTQKGDSTSVRLQPPAAAGALQPQPQPQPWSDSRLLALLQSVLLNGGAHSAPVDDDFAWALGCTTAACTIGAMDEWRTPKSANNTGSSSSTMQPAASTADTIDSDLLPVAVMGEMLLLTLDLLQRLQQLRKAVAGVGSSGSSRHSHNDAVAAASPQSVAAEADKAHWALIGLLSSLDNMVQAALLKDELLRQEHTIRKLQLLLATGSAVEAGTSEPATGNSAAAEQLLVVWQQQMATICRVYEGYVRDTWNSLLPAEMD